MDGREFRGKIGKELGDAEEARAAGNEPRARVCARRAAGWAVGFYLTERFGEPTNPDAVKLLRRYRELPGEPEDLRAAARRLSTRVTEDRTHPFPEDPLEDARCIIRGVLDILEKTRPGS